MEKNSYRMDYQTLWRQMKTLSETKREELAAETKRIQDEHDYNLQLVKDAKTIKPELVISDKDATRVQRGIEYSTMKPIGIACDNCGIELANTQPHIVLTSMPPCIAIGCAGCGWLGYKSC